MKIQMFIGGFAAGVISCVALWGLSVIAEDFSPADKQYLEEKNMAIAVEFYDRLLNQLDYDKARELMGDYYVQHNPHAKDGFEGIKAHIDMLKENYPLNHGDIKRVFANGDLVALHVHSKRYPDHLGNAIVDMFRIKDGKVVEHWDVVQAVPEESLNDNTMF